MAGNDQYTTLLLHCNGTDGSTVISDDSIGGQNGNATVYSGAQLSTEEKKFGISSLELDGTDDYITFTDANDWSFGTGDWTADLWVYLTDDEYANNLVFGGDLASWLIFIRATDPYANIISIYSSTNVEIMFDMPEAITFNAWHHLAGSRYGNELMAFWDGEKCDVTSGYSSDVTGIDYNHDPVLEIGIYEGGWAFKGYMDEIRISKGIARWTDDFTPPTGPYGTMAPMPTNRARRTSI